MNFSRLRGGVDLGFKLMWPFKITMGYTFNHTGNGEFSGIFDVDGKPVPWTLYSTLIDAGLQVRPVESVMLAIGHRHLDANGRSLDHFISSKNGVVYDDFAYSIRWDVSETANIQFTYENQYFTSPEVPGDQFQINNIYTRLSVYF
jgi:hypothetical protein